MSTTDLAAWVNSVAGPDGGSLEAEDRYSAKTVLAWLHICGFQV